MRCFLAAVICSAAFAGTAPAIRVSTPPAFSTPDRITLDPAVDRWWDTLHDRELSSLIDRAIASNLDVKAAGSRILQVKAERRIARAALLPSIDETDSSGRIRGGFENGNVHAGSGAPGAIFVAPFETNLFQIGFDASWEMDLFGARRHELEAATADVHASEEMRRDVLIGAIAEVARAYIGLRGDQRRSAITKQNLALQQDSLHLTSVRADAGLGTQFDVERQTEQLRSTEAQIPIFEAAIAVNIHLLGELLGEEPNALGAELSPEAAIPAQPPTVPVGLPAALLTRRPDVRRARMDVIASAARVGAARADLFPKILLTGAAGRQSTDLSGFALGAGNFFSLAPAITVPIFEGGRLRANLAARRQELDQAVTEYQSTVLQALRETEDRIANYSREQERRDKLARAVDASEQATQMASELYRRGLTDFLSVLDAQREQLATEDELIQSQTAEATDLVALYKALGGGWQ